MEHKAESHGRKDVAILREAGKPVEVFAYGDGHAIASPVLIAGGVIVKMLCVEVSSMAKAVLGGHSPFTLPTPYTPGTGGVGIVESISDDVYGLTVGDLVVVDPLHIAQSNSGTNPKMLLGWFSLCMDPTDKDGQKQLQHFKNGTWSCDALLPASCLYVIPKSIASRCTIEELLLVKIICISHGALVNSEFKTGDSILINGASGTYGGWVVLLALILNAANVYVMGRNKEALQTLVDLDPSRVHMVLMSDSHSNSENAEAQVKTQLGEAYGRIDRYVDFLGYAPNADSAMAAMKALRQGGFAVLAGGVQANITLPYGYMLARELTIRGSFMYPPTSFPTVLSLLPALCTQFKHLFSTQCYDSLKDINAAIEYKNEKSSFHTTIIYPNSKAFAEQHSKAKKNY